MNASSPRERILLAAYECMSQAGYAHVSLRDIASRAGVALSQLHYYFASKENLLLEVVSMVVGRRRQQMRTQLDQAGTPQERVRVGLRLMWNWTREQPQSCRIFFDLISLTMWRPDMQARVQEMYNDMRALVAEQVERMRPALRAEWRNVPAEAMAAAVVGMLDGVMLQYAVDPQRIHDLQGFLVVEQVILSWFDPQLVQGIN